MIETSYLPELMFPASDHPTSKPTRCKVVKLSKTQVLDKTADIVKQCLLEMNIAQCDMTRISQAMLDCESTSDSETLITQIVDSIVNGHLTFDDSLTMPTDELSQLYVEKLTEALAKWGITYEQYLTLSKPTFTDVTSDPLIAEIQAEDSLKVRQIQQHLRKKGYENLYLAELNPLLDNLIASLEVDLTLVPEEAKKHFDGLIAEIKLFQQQFPRLEYKQALVLSTKYMLMKHTLNLYSLPDNANIPERMSLDALVGFLKEIAMIDSTNVSENVCLIIKQQRRYFQGLDYTHNYFYAAVSISEYFKKPHNYLIWPSFDSFDMHFFNLAARYNIYVAGISTSILNYHDSTLMTTWYLYGHDFYHAIENTSASNCSNQLVLRREVVSDFYTFTQRQPLPPLVVEATRTLFFFDHHEMGKCPALLVLEANKSIQRIKYTTNELIVNKLVDRFVLKQGFSCNHLRAGLFLMLLFIFTQPRVEKNGCTIL
ncbi:MAG: hypothetical protein ACPGUD_07855 [Parashewanella sp.]